MLDQDYSLTAHRLLDTGYDISPYTGRLKFNARKALGVDKCHSTGGLLMQSSKHKACVQQSFSASLKISM